MGELVINDSFLRTSTHDSNKSGSLGDCCNSIIGAIATSTSSIGTAEAIAIDHKGVKADGQVIAEAGHWSQVPYITQEACTNEANQLKAPDDRGKLTDESTDNQVQEIGTQSTECGDVTQSAEINNSVTDESTTNDESTTTNIVSEGEPIPDIDP